MRFGTRVGLAVTAAVGDDEGWTVTHVHAAKAFLSLGDWSRTATAMSHDVPFRTTVKALRERLREEM